MWRLSLVGLAACGRLNFESIEDPSIPGDGQPPPSDANVVPPACPNGFGPWGSVQRLTNTSTAAFDRGPAVHPSGLVIVFDTVVGGNRELAVAKRSTTEGLFGEPTLIDILNTSDDEIGPGWSPDGTKLFFHRVGNVDERMVAPYLGMEMFGAATIDATFPSGGEDPSFSPDGTELFFTTYSGDADVAHARLVGGQWVMDDEVDALNSQLLQGYPAFDVHTQTVYFERDNGIGGAEIAAATRATPTSQFGAPFVVTELMMNAGKNGDPHVSADGTQMVFSSERPGSALNDLYLATRPCL